MRKILLRVLLLCMAICATLCAFSACGDNGNSNNPLSQSQSQTGMGDNSQTRPEGTKELKVTTNIPEGATVSGSGYYKYNDNIHATAQIKDGYMFLGWYVNDDDCVSNQTEYNGKMWNQDVEFSAKVIKIPEDITPSAAQQGTNKNYTLTVETIDANYGLVSLDDQNNQEKYTASYRQGQSFKVLAYSKTSDRFVGWYGLSGELITTNATFTMTMPYFDYMLVAVWDNIANLDEKLSTLNEQFNAEADAKNFEYEQIDGKNEYAIIAYNGNRTSVSIPSTYNGKPVSEIGEYCFNDDYWSDDGHIVNIIIPDSVKGIRDGAFSMCFFLENIIVDANNTNYSSLNGILYNKNKTELIEVPKCIQTVALPSTVTSMDESAFNAFANGNDLNSITVENGNSKYHSNGNCLIETASKTLILGCCNSVIPSDGSVTSIGASAFLGCESLRNITIPNSVTSIGSGAFAYCYLLDNVIFSNTSGWRVSYDSDMWDATELLSSDLANKSTAAQYLKRDYSSYYWKRG